MAMRKYRYVAVNLQKQKIKGSFIAKDEKDLANQLAKQSLFVVSCKPYPEKTKASFFSLSFGTVSVAELTNFCRQFSIMINTNIPILDCIGILKSQSYSGFFIRVLETVYDDVKGGSSLHGALDKHKKVFPDFFRSMVFVGEQSGKLDKAFSSLADYYERDAALKGKIKSALAYPIILSVMALAIIILMFAVVVPTFRKSMETLEVSEISGLTKAIYDMSDFITENWNILLLGLFALAAIIFLVLRTEKGKYAFDYLKMNLPFLKTAQTNILTAKFARAFGLLLSSGMDITGALDAVEVILGNRYVRKRFHAAAESIKHGVSIAVAFESYKLFPQIMIQMIQIGEKTASLDEVLSRACNFFDLQVSTSMDSLVAKIQPIMLLIIGAIVGVLFIAVYSPMLTIMEGLNV